MKIYDQFDELFGKLTIDSDKLSHDGYYTKTYILYPTNNQKLIISEWFKAYTLMYNATIEYFNIQWNNFKKKNRIKKQKKNKKLKGFSLNKKDKKYTFNLNIGNIKKQLLREKEIIINNSGIVINNKMIKVDSHLLDYAINDAITRYTGCLTNLKRRNIKHFRIRKLKLNRNNQILKLEKLAFKKSGFSISKLGPMKINCDNFNYENNVHTVATLHYNKTKDIFRLLVKYKQTNKITTKIPNNVISIDPGIRVPFTGYSSRELVEIGNNFYPIISKKLKFIDNIKGNNIKKSNYKPSKIKNPSMEPLLDPIVKGDLSNKLKKKIIDKQSERIKNLIKDFHWKTINYLTKTYDTIIIGNFSTKSMGESDMVNKMVKRIGNALSFFQFKERLKYKCIYSNTKYKHCDEAYTSKCCCKCGTYNKNLGSNKRYECINQECKLNIKRDINGAINILINSLH
jgi:putative transposase